MPIHKFFASILGIMLVFTALSCEEDLQGGPSETKVTGPYLRADVSSVIVPAQELKAAPTDKAVMISSNRAWTASVEPAADWVHVSCLSGANEDRTAKKTLVVFSFEKYEDEETDRQTTFKLQGEDGLFLEIPILQRKAIPIPLILQSGEESVTVLAEMPGGDTFDKNLTITTNISWTAAFVPEVDWVSISPAKYEQEDREEVDVNVVLTFQSNESITDGRNTVLVLTAAGGKGSLEIPIIQNKKEAVVQWVSEATDYVSSAAGSVTLDFVATAAWTASLENASEGISLSASSGDASVTSLTVHFTEFPGPGAVRGAMVVLSLSNGAKASLQVRQIGTYLSLNFIDGNQPFTTTIPYGEKVVDTVTDYILSCNGGSYAFSFYSSGGYTFVKGADGKTCGLMTNKNDWALLPGVEGWKLKSVELYTSNMGSGANKGFALRETADGANLAVLWVPANGATCTLTMPSTPAPVAGKRYYLVSQNNTGYYSKMHLIYEK